MQKQKLLSLVEQKIRLEKTYGALIKSCDISRSMLTCVMQLQPSPESIKYTVKITFKHGFYPQVYLLDPAELATYEGKTPHHVYEKRYPARLCVFYPKLREWKDRMYLADSFVPWVCTWLNAYEYWQITGLWLYPESKDTRPKGKN